MPGGAGYESGVTIGVYGADDGDDGVGALPPNNKPPPEVKKKRGGR